MDAFMDFLVFPFPGIYEKMTYQGNVRPDVLRVIMVLLKLDMAQLAFSRRISLIFVSVSILVNQ